MATVDLVGKYVFITGAGSGIGRSSAIAFATAGAKIIATDINQGGLDEVRSAIEDNGGFCRTEILDVTDETAVIALAGTLGKDGQIPYVVFNNAGVGGAKAFMNTPDREWELYFAINVYGMIYGIRAFVNLWRQYGLKGHIVNTASSVGVVASPYMAPYSCSKGAAYFLSESVAGELMDEGIRVTTVCPGAVNTNITSREDTVDYKPDQLEKIKKFYREKGMDPDVLARGVVRAVQKNKAVIYPAARQLNVMRRLLPAMTLRKAVLSVLRSMGLLPEIEKG